MGVGVKWVNLKLAEFLKSQKWAANVKLSDTLHDHGTLAGNMRELFET